MDALPSELVSYILNYTDTKPYTQHYVSLMLICKQWYNILLVNETYQKCKKYYEVGVELGIAGYYISHVFGWQIRSKLEQITKSLKNDKWKVSETYIFVDEHVVINVSIAGDKAIPDFMIKCVVTDRIIVSTMLHGNKFSTCEYTKEGPDNRKYSSTASMWNLDFIQQHEKIVDTVMKTLFDNNMFEI